MKKKKKKKKLESCCTCGCHINDTYEIRHRFLFRQLKKQFTKIQKIENFILLMHSSSATVLPSPIFFSLRSIRKVSCTINLSSILLICFSIILQYPSVAASAAALPLCSKRHQWKKERAMKTYKVFKGYICLITERGFHIGQRNIRESGFREENAFGSSNLPLLLLSSSLGIIVLPIKHYGLTRCLRNCGNEAVGDEEQLLQTRLFFTIIQAAVEGLARNIQMPYA